MTGIAELEKEIKGLGEDVKSSVVDLRSEVDDIKTKWDGLKPQDVITQEKWDKMSEAITANMDEIQKKQAKIDTQLKRGELGLGGLEAKRSEARELSAKNFDTFLRTGDGPEGRELKEFWMMPEKKAMSTDVAQDGGYAVLTERVAKTVTRVFETSPMRQVADVMSGSSKSIELLIDDDEHDANRTGEGSASSDTDTAELGLKTITVKKYDAEPRATTEMLEDGYFDIEGWSMNKAERRISRLQNADTITGTGVTGLRGIMTYAAWTTNGTYERNKLEQVNLGHASTLTSDGLIELQNSLIEDYQPGATWLMPRATFGAALQLKGNDQYHFSQTLLRDGQAQPFLLGKPVLFCADIASVAANALAMAYGDFSTGYTIYDRVGLQVLRDPYSNKGFMTFYISMRAGGDVTSFDAIKIGKVAA
jgi:HK97 family phage major capsid protein